ncbi:MAG TPA: AraC family transcriptional regulator [Gammaproteobacteria bacterium]|jgi:AraC-like DNA-binding protein|nr:AraC family transcriptional regulator [Gammaproteobacteria bacterium]
MDVLADIFRALRLRGAVYFRAAFHAPWGMKIPDGRFASFHVVCDGSCWLRASEDDRLVELGKGDVVVFPRGQGHSLLFEPDAEPVLAQQLISQPKDDAPADCVAFGGSGTATTSLICGHFEYLRDLPHPLFETLPQLVHLKGSEGDGGWIIAASALAAEVSAGGETAINTAVDRLGEALLIQILSTYIRSREDQASFLGAIQDRQIGHAIALMHEDIAHDWSLNELSEAASMSRSVFSERFRRLVGTPPMVYLARWRMLKARELLVDTGLPVAEISERVGYRSEFAFSKAFKKNLGETPGEVRRIAMQR